MRARRSRRVAVSQQPDPVPHHAGLPERERDEDADDVQLDEVCDVGLEEHEQQHRAASAEDDHAVRVDRAGRRGC